MFCGQEICLRESTVYITIPLAGINCRIRIMNLIEYADQPSEINTQYYKVFFIYILLTSFFL